MSVYVWVRRRDMLVTEERERERVWEAPIGI